MDLPEANSTTVRDLYCLWAACLCLSWSAVVMRALTWVVFIPRASRRCCALAVALHWRDSGLGISHARNYPRTFSFHEIFKCARLQFYSIWLQTDIHTHNFRKCSHASVGSIRVAPTRQLLWEVKATVSRSHLTYMHNPNPNLVSFRDYIFNAYQKNVSVNYLFHFYSSALEGWHLILC